MLLGNNMTYLSCVQYIHSMGIVNMVYVGCGYLLWDFGVFLLCVNYVVGTCGTCGVNTKNMCN